MAGNRHFAGVDPAGRDVSAPEETSAVPRESNMLGLARLSLKEAERLDGEACARPRDDARVGRAREVEAREVALGTLQATIATAELLQRLVGREGEVPGIDERIRAVVNEFSGARPYTKTDWEALGYPKSEREEALERVGRLLGAAAESGEHVIVAFDYPRRSGHELGRPAYVTVGVPEATSGRPSPSGESRLERELHPATSRTRRAGA